MSSGPDPSELLGRRDGHVLHLTLNRPDKGNALSASLVSALTDALAAAHTEKPRLLVITGSGKHFCTGFDLSGLDSESDDSLLARFTRVELLLQAIHAAPFDTVAIAQGRAMGAGADLFCACAHRWIAGQASFAFPGTGFGLVLGTARLADAVGALQAREWVQGGHAIEGGAALAAGLAQNIYDPAQREAALDALVHHAGRLDPATHAAIQLALGAARRPRGDAGDGLDLLRLVQSAARPGLRDRIAAYRAASQKT